MKVCSFWGVAAGHVACSIYARRWWPTPHGSPCRGHCALTAPVAEQNWPVAVRRQMLRTRQFLVQTAAAKQGLALESALFSAHQVWSDFKGMWVQHVGRGLETGPPGSQLLRRCSNQCNLTFTFGFLDPVAVLRVI